MSACSPGPCVMSIGERIDPDGAVGAAPDGEPEDDPAALAMFAPASTSPAASPLATSATDTSHRRDVRPIPKGLDEAQDASVTILGVPSPCGHPALSVVRVGDKNRFGYPPGELDERGGKKGRVANERGRWQMGRTGRGRSGVVLAVALMVTLAPAAFAQDGESTPGVNVSAVNAGTSRLHSDLQISLTARTERSTVPDPSCRPQDLTLRCWGSLFLRVPERGGMIVTVFEVHRVAVGDISCGDDDSGGCEDEGGGCEDEGECGDEGGMAVSTATVPVQAQVNGVAVLTDPGDTGLPTGTKVQVQITLTDNGTARYVDLAEVQVNEFVPGPLKPLLYAWGPQVIQQVQIRLPVASG